MPISYLFPTPVYTAMIKDEDAHFEINKYMQDLSSVDMSNPWNDTVKTTFKYKRKNCVLDQMPTLNGIIEKHCNNFLNQLKTNRLYNHFNYIAAIEESWLNISHQNGFQHFHIHPQCDLSGVFYHQTNCKDGDIEFLNPSLANRLHKLTMRTHIFPILPEKGKIIIFPNFLEHRVHVNCTESARISLAFNANANKI
jgi:uncharacterized protein (TIGR02466 family)